MMRVRLNGSDLQEGDVMTLHVALESFGDRLLNDQEFRAGVGAELVKGYLYRIERLRAMIHRRRFDEDIPGTLPPVDEQVRRALGYCSNPNCPGDHNRPGEECFP